MDIDSITLDVTAPGDVMVRVRGLGVLGRPIRRCASRPTDDGWIVLRDVPVGRIVVELDESGRSRRRRGPLRRACDIRPPSRSVTFP